MISFVGAGPGAADLLTVRAVDRLAAADVVIWASSLVAPGILDHCRGDVVLHDSKTMTLADVCAVFAAHPQARIVRLHSGDPTIYSAIAEQIEWCRASGRAFEIVPGVSSMAAAAATAGVELTRPAVAQSVVLTRLAKGTKASMPDRETIDAFAATGATLVVFLSVAHVEALAARLLAAGSAYTENTPVVVVHRASWPDERVIRTDIAGMATCVREAGFDVTTLFLIGPAMGAAAGAIPSHVYSEAYSTRFRAAQSAASG
jgi:precorrin-4/cobalt-precorrin-4 C11-methyltransferase